MINFIEWLKLQEGWASKTKVPTGLAKDVSPGHPNNAKDPEKNPAKHRGTIHTHVGKKENAPKHPKNAVDPK